MSRVARAFRRLPIRVKLALISMGVMSVVMAGTGVFLYLRFEDELDSSIDQALSSRAVAASVLSTRSERALIDELRREEGFGELLGPDGRVVVATAGVGDRVLVPRRLLPEARRRTVYFDLKHLTGITKHARLVARPAAGRRIVVAGTVLRGRERANESLVRSLVIGVPVALFLAVAAAIALIGGALRPVEQMRRRAATISPSDTDARLPLPEAQDEIRRLGSTLNAMLERLQRAFTRERAFVADASHELRTPLAILKAELELAAREGRTKEELAAAIRSAGEEVDRLTHLAEDLLVLARVDDGALLYRGDVVAVDELVTAVAASFEDRAGAQGRAITTAVAPGLVVDGDAVRLRQALANLVENAIVHGGGQIAITARSSGNSVQLHVEDRGPGFPADFIGHAFERFTRADAARTRGGTGLGLAIVDAVARGHGGSASARNTGSGSDVWLELPRQSSPRRSNGSATQSPPNSASPSAPVTTAAASE